MEVRVLARRGGKVKQIARELGVSRNTVRRYLRDPDAGRYRPRAARVKKLDPFREYLQSRIEAAQPRWIPATVLLREIREHGYDGGLSQLKAYLAPFKATKPDPVVRFETPPGEQMQADFTHDPPRPQSAQGVRRDTGLQPRHVRSLHAAGRQRDAAVVPATSVRDVRRRDGRGAVRQRQDDRHRSRRLWAGPAPLARGIEGARRRVRLPPRLCRPYRARTKGKVERFNGYLKGSFVTPLAATLKSAASCSKPRPPTRTFGRWLDEVAHQRDHGTTGEKPAVRLEPNGSRLLPLPILTMAATPATSWRFLSDAALPLESLQHPLAVYEQLLEVRA